jgi:hypothetical protein
MFANTQRMGMDLGFPDVCMTPATPPFPFSYPNIAAGPMGVPAAYKVLVAYAPAHNMSTVIPLTNGDNAGVCLGVASGLVMGPQRHLLCSFTCLIGGMPASRMTSVGIHNSTNCPGSRLVPSQMKVMVLAP